MLDRCKHDSFLPSICELTQRDGRGNKTLKPCVTRVTSLFEKRFFQTSISLKHFLCKRPGHSDVNERSQQNTQLIALSCSLSFSSHTNVLQSFSFCRHHYSLAHSKCRGRLQASVNDSSRIMLEMSCIRVL